MRHTADKLLNKLMSRKLMVWLTATGLMLTHTVPLESSELGRHFFGVYRTRRVG